MRPLYAPYQFNRPLDVDEKGVGPADEIQPEPEPASEAPACGPASDLGYSEPPPTRVIYQDWIVRGDLRANPEWLYIFGDNFARYGLGGQAKEMRGEPNALGIPTKNRPATDPAAYFDDSEAMDIIKRLKPDFARLADYVRKGGTIVVPSAGIGTDRAQLEQRAPQVFTSMRYCLAYYGIKMKGR